MELGGLCHGVPLPGSGAQRTICREVLPEALRDLESTTPEEAKAVLAHELMTWVQQGARPARGRYLAVLRALAGSSIATFAQLLHTERAVEVLLNWLADTRGSSELRAVLGTLRALARGSDAHRRRMVELGVVTALVPLASTRPKSSRMQSRRAVVRTLRVLARLPQAAQAMLQGIPPAVLRETWG